MLGEAIRIARSFLGISQKELAASIGVTNGYLSQIESGAREPSQKILRAIAGEIGVPTSSLLFFAENLSANESSADLEARQKFGRKILLALTRIDEETL
ncbi:helix-turn-helix transcriptional regulator [Qipengyuania sp. XHP0207]|uniref:helix-turn-helix domain-containing protein n=1 Tax=Qipengyuania sp. XHP0207 TaxID=3038078 RepID=UPI00241DA86A|nr:helix-turn-helix transcriptional regulator [Qipengyuania sp. XHP0207]MDG5746699.1 helix-turn-helix transcriptional regulator [Qipengyuania sp. XHP0207]